MQSGYLSRHFPDSSLPDGVLQIGNNFFVGGGSDRYFFDISAAMARAGVRVIPFAPRDGRNEATAWSKYFPVSLRTDHPRPRDVFRFIYSTAAKRNLKQLLRDERIQLAHLHIYYGRLTASILPVLVNAGIPIVQTVHDFKLVCPVYSCLRNGQICEDCHGQSFWKAAVFRCNRGSMIRSFLSSTESYVSKGLGSHSSIDHYIAVSDFQKERLLANQVCTPDRITTIHNAVHPAAFDWDDNNGKYVCYFGRIEKLKGMQTLLEAMRQLPNVQLKIERSATAS